MIEENHQVPEQDLAGAIRDLLAHLRGPKVAPEDELWTTREIGEYLKLSPATVEGRVVTRPDFPAPLQPCGTVKASKRWFAVDVKKWARQNSSKLPKGKSRK
ncbi:hypothetical protein ACM70Y_12515 [Pseudomonas aeruginosa]|nr:hypothetical protein [Pseudomonas aeruginosa]